MGPVWTTLVGNLACVALIISMWMHLSYRLHGLTKRQSEVCFGLALGLAAIASMAMSVRFEPGIYLDLRLSMILVSAVFGGLPAVTVTVVLAAACRIFMGGAGMSVGLTAMLVVAVAGLCLQAAVRRNAFDHPARLAIIASAAAALSVGALHLLPSDMAGRVLQAVGLPIALSNFAATAAAGWAVTYFRQFTLERDILHAALTQAPNLHYVKNLQGRFVVTNANMALLHGRQRSSEMVGLSDFDLETRQRAQVLFEAEQALLASGGAIVDLEDCVERDGGARWYSTSKVSLKNAQGDLIGLAGVSADITEKRRLAEDLRNSRDLMSRAMTEMSDGLAMFDSDGYLILCNEQYRALFPRSASARVPGAHITDIVRAVARTGERIDLPFNATDVQIREIAATLHRDQDEFIRQSDGRWVNLRRRIGQDGTVLVVASDITLLKESEERLRALAEQMKDLAATDPLTGLANRRTLDAFLERQLAAVGGDAQSVALLLIDVDHFKIFNDTYGHGAGDDCLRMIGREIKAAARRGNDLGARYGGEEFCIVLPGATLDSAVMVADGLRDAIRRAAIHHRGSHARVVTVSIGVAALAGPALMSPAAFIHAADRALYSAKRLGRDRTETSPSCDIRTDRLA